MKRLASDKNEQHMLIKKKMLTSHCSFISKAVEGAATQLAGTVAFNSNNLNLTDWCSVLGQGRNGDNLGKSEWRRLDNIDSVDSNLRYLLFPPSANSI